jgi:hypothetical protein
MSEDTLIVLDHYKKRGQSASTTLSLATLKRNNSKP